VQLVLGLTLPLFALILAGYVAGKRGWFGREANVALGGFVFYYALPVLLFRTMATAPLDEPFDWRFVAVYAGAGLAVNLFAHLTARWCFGCTMGEAALQGMAAHFGNIVIVALPLAVLAFGPAAALPIALYVTVDNAIAIPLATALLAAQRAGAAGLRCLPATLALAMAKNPMIVSVFLGLAWLGSGLALPGPVDSLAKLLAGAAVPCALFSLGATLAGQPVADRIGEAAFMTATKLFLHPAAVFLAILLLVPEPNPVWVATSLLTAAMPIGLNAYLLAQGYGTYIARTSTAVLLSTGLSVVTVSLLLGVLVARP